ncbi:Membrane carboxypeptidase (penicillin-binding protein) [Streptoalloteichus tenebrarius]|uniref:Membrane carboxypeptidase (Penicillin-binding protein) n=1 Tax=Streptoalloteichus tenebrarius (strain ATCC 17920 / DSM 40477 / JCM 4838 / CBS 697.72 / NBRC 16177 / NCIMB 11028 / NRRL B-12390 / A12253. 1 / ISP 5477) TaxID=1933 RepID=A0ABT1I450_STRSD|nr:transglycosylase domain-containing protein [Streptoalloteichus tenebrarius]MCP2262560.1 Membrane carboxypeptidase (penicillin-binding protein) [Streptoalloteichus tenebrarius]BFF00750.1 transglycosylase domain-containing protein [Streptoalloteichus tenebrarius]
MAKLLGLCVVAGVLVAAMLFPVFGGLGLASNQAAETVDKVSADLVSVDPPLLTTITDKDGNPIAYLYDQDRVIVGADKINDTMKAAIVAIEDHRFFDHNGVDWQGTMRAMVKNAASDEITGGGSSLTQQYVKNYLAFVVAKDAKDPQYKKAIEQTPARKLKEIRIALDLERKLSKDEILTRYLNIVPFPYQIYGVAEASRAFFDTSPDKLEIHQAALLAAMVNMPGVLNPVTNPEGAKKRRDIVIDKMAENKMLSRDDEENRRLAEEYKAKGLGVLPELNLRNNGCVGAGPTDGFFCEYALSYLKKAGLDMDQVKRGGYTIRTTLDKKASTEAKKAAEATVSKTTRGVANTMAIIEPGQDRHKVRALVANRDFGNDADKGQSSYELPSQVTPFGAGSIFKIFTAAAYMQQKNAGISRQVAVPETYTSPVFKDGGRPWTVKNATAPMGSTTIQGALAHSPNTPFVKLEEEAGLKNVVDMAYKLGMRESLKEVNTQGQHRKAGDNSWMSVYDRTVKENNGSFTLGVTPASALELSNVGATIMSDGRWCPPSPIEQILDRNGRPVPIQEAPCEQVVEPALARSLAQGMSQDSVVGTAKNAAAANGWSRPMIGKTGTTENHWSSGFLGATRDYSGAVLVFTDGVAPQVICHSPVRLCGQAGTGAYGGDIAAPTWFKAMGPLHADKPDRGLPEADPRYR